MCDPPLAPEGSSVSAVRGGLAHRPVTPAVTGRGWGRGSRLWAGARAPRAQGACGQSPGLWCGAADGQGVSRNPTVSARDGQGLEERGPWGQGRWEEDEWHWQEEPSEAAACRGRPASTGRAPVPGVARTLQTALLPGGLAAWSVPLAGEEPWVPWRSQCSPGMDPVTPVTPLPHALGTGRWPRAAERSARSGLRRGAPVPSHRAAPSWASSWRGLRVPGSRAGGGRALPSSAGDRPERRGRGSAPASCTGRPSPTASVTAIRVDLGCVFHIPERSLHLEAPQALTWPLPHWRSGRAGPQEPLNLASGPAVRFALDAACGSPGVSHARCPSSDRKQSPAGASPAPRGAVAMEMPALCRAAPPHGPAPAAHEGPRLGPHGWRSLPPVVGVSCVLHGARAPPGPPAASASDLALPVPAGSLTSVFVRLPCGGVGVSVPLACT